MIEIRPTADGVIIIACVIVAFIIYLAVRNTIHNKKVKESIKEEDKK